MKNDRMHRVIEAAKLLGVSKVTVYKKMDLLKRELKSHIHHRSNITYLDEEGLEILRQSLQTVTAKEAESAAVPEEPKVSEAELLASLKSAEASLTLAYDQHSTDLLQHLETLNHAVRVRREEVERKEQQLRMLQRLVKWNQSSAGFVEKMQDALFEKRE